MICLVGVRKRLVEEAEVDAGRSGWCEEAEAAVEESGTAGLTVADGGFAGDLVQGARVASIAENVIDEQAEGRLQPAGGGARMRQSLCCQWRLRAGGRETGAPQCPQSIQKGGGSS